MTGGCQCGAIRYRVASEPKLVAVCHCRMCQKASGSILWPFLTVPREALAWTLGRPAHFRSSAAAERGFCAACGTPLTFRYVHSERIAVSIGSLDEPEKVAPKNQVGIEGRLSWFATLPTLPDDKTTEEDEPALAAKIAASNHQHPDHDTERWPPEPKP